MLAYVEQIWVYRYKNEVSRMLSQGQEPVEGPAGAKWDRTHTHILCHPGVGGAADVLELAMARHFISSPMIKTVSLSDTGNFQMQHNFWSVQNKSHIHLDPGWLLICGGKIRNILFEFILFTLINRQRIRWCFEASISFYLSIDCISENQFGHRRMRSGWSLGVMSITTADWHREVSVSHTVSLCEF